MYPPRAFAGKLIAFVVQRFEALRKIATVIGNNMLLIILFVVNSTIVLRK